MYVSVGIDEFLESQSGMPIIDVRSPSEFAKGHIPFAVNIPLLTDDERAAVGIVYKQKSKEKAIELGYTFVKPKLNYFIEESKALCSSEGIVVHCWRGGMRSKSFAEHLANNGITNVYLIEGGYKTFRNKVTYEFEKEYKLNVLGGYTGSGKTEILKRINQKGYQVVDLEGIANHKGSAFGGIGCGNQPSTEQFENNLYWIWKELDKTKNIWIEDESRMIGSVRLPTPLYDNIREQEVYFIDIPRMERAKHLVQGYSKFDENELANAILRISKRLGGLNTKLALDHLKNKNFFAVADLSLGYYDKYYKRGLLARNQKKVHKIKLSSTNHETNANEIIRQSE